MISQFKPILKKLSVTNYDNGHQFTKRDRLDAISDILKDSEFKKISTDGLFEMYAIGGVLPQNAIVVSTHVDCVTAITDCFSEDFSDELLKGTFDNLITNAIIVYLMKEHRLNENVVVAFTGDEEKNSCGAIDVIEFIENHSKEFKAVILDVTDMGWDEGALFSVENNFWNDCFGKKVVDICEKMQVKWVFVPSDVDDLPVYVPQNRIINTEALCDESWEYDEADIECFSLCIPTKGEMHSNSGLLARKESVTKYAEVLTNILNGI